MKISKTIYNHDLRKPFSVTVEIDGIKKEFLYPDECKKVGEFVKNIWKDQFFTSEAYIYYNIDWDSDHILYCKYELVNE